jgi:Homeodomain-like domain
MTQSLKQRNPDVSVQSNTRADLRPINPKEVQVPQGTIPDTKEVERIVQLLKNKGSLPEVIITSDNSLIRGIDALEAAKQIGQPLILASVQKARIESLKIQMTVIKLDGGTQSRAGINQQVIDEYAVAWRDGAKFPPIIAFYDGENYWLADGFHRCISAKQANVTEIEADIRQGTRRDAVLYSVGANSNHGLRRTNDDKRRAVSTLLSDEEWGGWSDREIARRCGVHHDTVGRIRTELSFGIPKIDEGRKVNRGGTTYTQKVAIDKPWHPLVTETVEIIGGEHKGKHAEIRVIVGNMAMCLVEGDEEDKRRNIYLSDMKPQQIPQQPPTSVKEELRQKQEEMGFGRGEQLFPEIPRNEEPLPEQLPASMPNFAAIGDALVTEVAIALMRLTPEEINQAIRKASANWSGGQIEAAYQALNEYRRVAA